MTIVIQTRNLSKHYGPVHAVDGVNLRVKRGEVYGFLGLNGVSKTTTIRALLGMIRPSTGGIRLFGTPISPGGPTSRTAIVSAKFVVVVIWATGLTALVFMLGLLVGTIVGLPGWSAVVLWRAVGDLIITAALTIALMPPVALLASVGRGYLPPLGWATLTLFLAQILAALGWGAWFPWSVPALFSGLA